MTLRRSATCWVSFFVAAPAESSTTTGVLQLPMVDDSVGMVDCLFCAM